MRPIDVEDFNNKLVNSIYKEVEKMVEQTDKEDINELLILQEKLGGLLLILRRANEMDFNEGI